MDEWKGQAIVLRLGYFREADIWLKLLCSGYGIFTVFAFGGCRSLRRFCGCLDLFNTLRCRIRTSGKYLNLQEADLLGAPRALRDDWRRGGVAANCVRFMEALPMGRESSAECFDLLENLRLLLEGEAEPQILTPFFFRLRVAGAIGFAPDFRICARCGLPLGDASVFLTNEGRGLCRACRKELRLEQKRYSVPLSENSLAVLRDVCAAMPTAWPNAGLSRADRGACAKIIDGFAQYHLGVVNY